MASEVSVHLIHNANAERNGYLIERLNQLSAGSPRFSAPHLVGYQAPLQTTSGLRPRITQRAISAYEHQAHRRYRAINSLRADIGQLVREGRRALRDLVRPLPDKDLRTQQIYIALTDKHIRAYSHFLEGPSDLIMVCEDDVRFEPDSAGKLQSLLSLVDGIAPDKYIYVDLAGGFAVHLLRVSDLALESQGFIKSYRKVVTNTSCCYLMNRALIERLYTAVIQDPELRRLLITRLINTVCYRTPDLESRRGLYALTDPPVFRHGSVVGAYETLIQPSDFHGTDGAGPPQPAPPQRPA